MQKRIDACRLLVKLMKIPSFSNEEKRICGEVYSLLKNVGFNVKKQAVDANGYNIMAFVGKPKIYLTAHLDTVKPFLKVKETKTHIYGRGACDTKGSVASMIAAAVECLAEGCTNFGLLFTVGEEDDFRGARMACNKIKIPFAVVGEPTSLEIVNGHYGILVLKVSSKGNKAHSSHPEQGVNAIDKLVEALHIIKQKMGVFASSSMSFAKLHAGIADNIVPDKAEATLSLRIAPDDSTDYLAKARRLVSTLASVEKTFEMKSILTNVPEEIGCMGRQRIVRYATELSLFRRGIVFGPGSIRHAHSDKEKVARKEILEAVKRYKKMIRACSK